MLLLCKKLHLECLILDDLQIKKIKKTITRQERIPTECEKWWPKDFVIIDENKWKNTKSDSTDKKVDVCECYKEPTRKSERKRQNTTRIQLEDCQTNCVFYTMDQLCTNQCPNYARCLNGPFSTRKKPKTVIKETQNCGWGLFCNENIPAESFVGEYVGKVFSTQSEYKNLMNEVVTTKTTYLLEVAERKIGDKTYTRYYIDSRYMGNETRFMNSSDEPNCEAKTFFDTTSDRFVIGIFTKNTSIHNGEELTWKYDFTYTKCLHS